MYTPILYCQTSLSARRRFRVQYLSRNLLLRVFEGKGEDGASLLLSPNEVSIHAHNQVSHCFCHDPGPNPHEPESRSERKGK